MSLSHPVATVSAKCSNAPYPTKLIEEELDLLTQDIDTLGLSEANKNLVWRIILGEERSGVNTVIPQPLEAQNTLLHLAVMYGKLTLMKILLAQGADIIVMNRANESPLLLAFKFDVRNPNNKQICVEMLKHLKSLPLIGNGDPNSVLKFFKDIQTTLNGCIDFNLDPGLRGKYWADSTFWNFFAKHRSFEMRTGLTTLDWDYFRYICQIYAQYYQTLLVSVRTFDPMALQSYILENYEAHSKIWGMYFVNKIYKLAHILPPELRAQAEHAKHARLAELQAENQRLIQEQTTLNTQISHFTQTSQEVSAVRAESSIVIADKDRLIAHLEAENSKLTLENNQLKGQLAELRKMQEEQAALLQIQAGELQVRKTEAAELRTTVQTQAGELQIRKTETAELRTTVQTQAGKLETQATRLQTQEGQLQVQATKLQTQEGELQVRKTEAAELRTTMQAQESKIAELKKRQEEIAELKKRQEEMELQQARDMLNFQSRVQSTVLEVVSKLTHLTPPGTTDQKTATHDSTQSSPPKLSAQPGSIQPNLLHIAPATSTTEGGGGVATPASATATTTAITTTIEEGTPDKEEPSRDRAQSAELTHRKEVVTLPNVEEMSVVGHEHAPTILPCQGPYVGADVGIVAMGTPSATSSVNDERLQADKKDDAEHKVDTTLTSH